MPTTTAAARTSLTVGCMRVTSLLRACDARGAGGVDRGEGTAEPVGQHLQALVRIGIPEAYHFAVVDLVVPTGDPGQRVEVLRLHGDVQPTTNLRPL